MFGCLHHTRVQTPLLKNGEVTTPHAITSHNHRKLHIHHNTQVQVTQVMDTIIYTTKLILQQTEEQY
jgi:hypothetical protein